MRRTDEGSFEEKKQNGRRTKKSSLTPTVGTGSANVNNKNENEHEREHERTESEKNSANLKREKK